MKYTASTVISTAMLGVGLIGMSITSHKQKAFESQMSAIHSQHPAYEQARTLYEATVRVKDAKEKEMGLTTADRKELSDISRILYDKAEQVMPSNEYYRTRESLIAPQVMKESLAKAYASCTTIAQVSGFLLAISLTELLLSYKRSQPLTNQPVKHARGVQ